MTRRLFDSFCLIALKLKIISLPSSMTYWTPHGTGALSGIGFTISLLMGSLVFEETSVNLLCDERLGILLGSFLSGWLGI
ncbi:MAG: Na+/H+ antiporter NhaA [Arenicellaceae bacterium]|nr:Na+/H+ antiporter NhaA [Arenicellaceae bacterium]